MPAQMTLFAGWQTQPMRRRQLGAQPLLGPTDGGEQKRVYGWAGAGIASAIFDMLGLEDSDEERWRLRIPKPKSSWRPRIALAVVGLALAAGVAVYLLRGGEEESLFLTAPLKTTSIVRQVQATGYLKLSETVEVPAPLAGQLLETRVKPGDIVEEGQVLALLGRAPSEMAVGVADAEFQAIRARATRAAVAHRNARASLKRVERLRAKQLASESELEAATTGAAMAGAALRAAQAERNAASKRLKMRESERDATKITAPLAGLVLVVPSGTGMFVKHGQPLLRIGAAPDDMRIQALFGETDIGEIKLGQRAVFEVPAFVDRVFEATVSHVNPDPQMDAGAVFYRVTLIVKDTDGHLLPGMTAQVRVKVAEVQNVLAVREAALRFTMPGAEPAAARSRVWQPDGDAAREIPVEAGLSDGAVTEVRFNGETKLADGDAIIIGLNSVGDGNATQPSLSLRRSK